MILDPNTSLVFDILRQLVLAEKPLEWRQANADLDKFRLAINADPELLRLATIYLNAPSPVAIRVLVDLENKLREKFLGGEPDERRTSRSIHGNS